MAEAPNAAWQRDTSVLVIAAHPDDEVIGAGRLLADHAGPVRCVTLTAGERCHGDHDDLGRVARHRLREWTEALGVLGVTPVETRRWPDGGLAGHEGAATEVVARLAAEADVVLAPWRHDPHPDHEAAGRVGAAAARRAGVPLWGYLVWTPYWFPAAEITRRDATLQVHPTSERAGRLRTEAIARHRSQLVPQHPAVQPVVPPELVDRHERQMLVQEPDDQNA
ncbi:PIG-L deacetylase family protein [Citricoccus sp. K5]|uniref:PIG-L deacetylase family protein n=1 Tax=Citricoccus sp. K5 TaxID=2653135 RepID=UPI0012EFF6B9|nr:PIG-L family deacetylase [Citricoccus sp. K5]VXB64801.1 PIG-L family deacetylase [Citricoccus sp. K5]